MSKNTKKCLQYLPWHTMLIAAIDQNSVSSGESSEIHPSTKPDHHISLWLAPQLKIFLYCFVVLFECSFPQPWLKCKTFIICSNYLHINRNNVQRCPSAPVWPNDDLTTKAFLWSFIQIAKTWSTLSRPCLKPFLLSWFWPKMDWHPSDKGVIPSSITLSEGHIVMTLQHFQKREKI